MTPGVYDPEQIGGVSRFYRLLESGSEMAVAWDRDVDLSGIEPGPNEPAAPRYYARGLVFDHSRPLVVYGSHRWAWFVDQLDPLGGRWVHHLYNGKLVP